MANNKLELAEALLWVSNQHDQQLANFMETKNNVLEHKNGVPSWGEDIDCQVATYIDGLGLCLSNGKPIFVDYGCRAMDPRTSGMEFSVGEVRLSQTVLRTLLIR